MPDDIQNLIKMGMLVIGIALCFFGFAIYRATIKTIGFILGFCGGVVLTIIILGDARGTYELFIIMALFVGLIVGWFGAWLAWELTKVVPFILGALIGYVAGMFTLMYLFGFGPVNNYVQIVAITIALIGGIVGIKIATFTKITGMALLGSILMVIPLGGMNIELILILSVLGILTQYGLFRKDIRKEQQSNKIEGGLVFGNTEYKDGITGNKDSDNLIRTYKSKIYKSCPGCGQVSLTDKESCEVCGKSYTIS